MTGSTAQDLTDVSVTEAAGPGRRTVAVWGSCVTRDAFAVASRAEELERRLPLVYYGARSSWVSQASRRWPERPTEEGLTGFPRRMVEEDLGKAVVDELVAHRPDLVVLDLCDERLPLVRSGRTWFTVSEYLLKTAIGEQVNAAPDERSSMTDPQRVELFRPAADRLAARLTRRLPDTVFVLNESPYTTRIADGTSLPEPQAGWARDLDAAQRPLFDALEAAFAGRLVRLTPPAEVCLADPHHRWGVTSYHYVEDYYHWLLDELLAVRAPQVGAGRRLRHRVDRLVRAVRR